MALGYRPLIVTFALSSTVSEILPGLYTQRQFFQTPLLYSYCGKNLGMFPLE